MGVNTTNKISAIMIEIGIRAGFQHARDLFEKSIKDISKLKLLIRLRLSKIMSSAYQKSDTFCFPSLCCDPTNRIDHSPM